MNNPGSIAVAVAVSATMLELSIPSFVRILAGNIQDPTMTDEAIQSHYGHRSVMATVVRGGETKEYKLKDLAPAEKLEKFVEDVRFGIYPITNFGLLYR